MPASESSTSTAVATSRRGPRRLYNDIVAIGAGLSGIALVAWLKREHNFSDIHLYERNADSGGTWFVNSYPGAACDVPSALYSYSFAQNPEWTCMMPPHNEIKAYQDSVAVKYGVPDRITFKTEAFRAEWLESQKRWRVNLRDLETEEEYIHECKILYSCTGALVVPNYPDIPGLKEFPGPVVHSARWDKNIDLKGKRVAVFGNGCTAAQIVPNIVDDASKVNQFIRSKHYIQRAPYFPITAVTIWVLKYVPFAMQTLRFIVFCAAEAGIRFQDMGVLGRLSRWLKRKEVVGYMKRNSPEKFHKDLIPDFEIGCKRRIMDPGYLRSLHNPKIDLVNIASSPVRIENNTIITDSGKYPADAIVLATGFRTNRFLSGFDVIGRGGKDLHEHWEKDLGGPGAYNCAVNHGFPNFFIVLGPNHATGHTSAIMAIENVIDYSLKVIKPILTGEVDVVEIKKTAEVSYVQRMQKALRNTVWATGCGSWYTTAGGWNAMSYPWSQVHFWYRCRFVKKSDWEYTYSPYGRVVPKKGSSVAGKMVAGATLGAVLAAASVAFLGVDAAGEEWRRLSEPAMEIVKGWVKQIV